jgi:hypothetical protein
VKESGRDGKRDCSASQPSNTWGRHLDQESVVRT